MNFIKKILPILIAISSLFLVACQKDSGSGYANVQEKLMKMEAYATDATIKYISNKGENAYEAKLYAKNTGEYRIETLNPKEVNGNIIIFDGNMVWQYNPRLDSKISVGMPDKSERKEISLFSFLENHLKSKDVSVETASTDKSVYSVLEAKIPEGNKFFATEKLWLNNETKLPEKLVIYDKEDKERVLVEYKNFEYNAKLDENLFKLDNITSKEQS